MDKYYNINVVIENNKKYNFDYRIRNDKLDLIIPDEKPSLTKINLITKLLIGNKLYFNNIYNEYYYITVKNKNFIEFSSLINNKDIKLNKTSYENIKKRNKYLFEIDAINIIDIIKTNKINKAKFNSLYFIKNYDTLKLYAYDDNYLITYKFNNNLIFNKKYKYYNSFLVDNDDNLFYRREYAIIPISKQFKHYNYIINLVKYKKQCNIIFSEDDLDLYYIGCFIHYLMHNKIIEINFSLRSIFYDFRNHNYLRINFYNYNNKIEIFSYRKIGVIPFII